MTERGNVVVPPGSTLSLNWGIDATPLVDAASGVDVVGPAIAGAKNDEGDVALVLESGTAQARVVHGGAVDTAIALTRGSNSTWVVAVQDGSTRIKVTRGEVEVRTRAVREVVRAGETLDALAGGRVVRQVTSVAASDAPRITPTRSAKTLAGSPPRDVLPAASSFEPAPAISDAERQTTANEGGRSGDSGLVAATLGDGARSSGDQGSGERESFALAELELADGEADDARLLLAPLLDSADASLAGDAAFLLSGSMATPRERLDVLDRYLAKPRCSPYLEQAEVERARALLAAGQEVDARAIVKTLRAKPNLPVVARAGLVRIERALNASQTRQTKQ